MQDLGLEGGTKKRRAASKEARRRVHAKKKRKGIVLPETKERERRRKGSGAILQQDQALEFCMRGYTYHDISEEMGISTSYAAVLVKKGMERFQLTLGLEFKDWQNKHLTQLAKLYRTHSQIAEAGGIKSAEICVKIIDLEAEIVGSKKAPQMFVAPPPENEYDISRLSVQELLQLRALMANAKPLEEKVISPPLLEHHAARAEDVVEGEIVEKDNGESTDAVSNSTEDRAT